MTQTKSTRKIVASCLVAALLVPLSAISLYMVWISSFYHPDRNHGSASATPAFIAAIACGGCCLWRLPIRWPYRLFCLFIYVPLMWVVLGFYTLFFLFIVYNFAIT
jgi:hypothetical protein